MSEFSKEVYENLVKEIKSLNPKLEQARDRGDFGTYKNLINAYSEVLRLIERCEDNLERDVRYMTYIDFECYPESKYRIILWSNGQEYYVSNENQDISIMSMVSSLTKVIDKLDSIYIDTTGFGKNIADCFKELGYKVKDVHGMNILKLRQFNS